MMKKILFKKIVIYTSILFMLFFLFSCGKKEATDGTLADNDKKSQTEETVIEDGKYTLIKKTQTDDYFAANFFTSENGAVGDGKTDDTGAIQQTLDKASQNGGGRVFIQGGRYKITSQIKIPSNVTLAGNFIPPSSKNSTGSNTENTLFLVEENEKTLSESLIILNDNSSIEGIEIWYSDQKYSDIKNYPYSIEQYDGSSVKISDIILTNSYKGILLNSKNSKDVILENIYMTPIETGLDIKNCLGRIIIENLNISPVYWINDSKTPKEQDISSSELTEALYSNLTAVYFGNIKDLSIKNLNIDSAAKGIHFNIPFESNGACQVSKANITNSTNNIFFESLGKNGAAFSASAFKTTNLYNTSIVFSGEDFKSPVAFNTCDMLGQPYYAIDMAGNGYFTFMNCNFSGWRNGAVNTNDGVVLASFNKFSSDSSLGILQNPAVGLFCNNKFPTEYPMADADYFFENKSEEEIKSDAISTKALDQKESYATIKNYIINAADYGASQENEDNTEAFQNAVNKISESGGGILFIPNGTYNLSGTLDVKQNVHIFGVSDDYGKNTVTTLKTTQDTKMGKTILQMQNNTSVNNIALEYAGEADLNFDEGAYPSSYAIKSEDHAQNITINNITLVNVPNGIKMDGVNNAAVKNVRATAMRYAAEVINSSNIIIKNCDFGSDNAPETVRNYQKKNAVSIYIYSGDNILLQSNSSNNANTGLYLDSDKNPAGTLTSTAFTARDVITGIYIKNYGSASVISPAIFPSAGETAANHIATASGNAGTSTVFNLIAAGSVSNSMIIRGGTVNIQSSIFKNTGKTMIKTEGGNFNLFASVIDTQPEDYHIEANGGSSLFFGNLLQSPKDFGALEAKYIKSTTDKNATFKEMFNIKECDIDLTKVELG